METLLWSILVLEIVLLVLLFPGFKRRILRRRELEERFLRSSARSKLALLLPRREVVLPPPELGPPEQAITAVKNYVGLEAREEARAVYIEAQKGNRVAQFIVGAALLRTGREEAGRGWLILSAARGFELAKQYLKKAG